jgi:hypothetical protein
MTKQTEALKLALNALHTKGEHHPRVYKAIAAIETVLAQPEQEQNEFELRGMLATLKCWHRLTQEEEEDLLRFAAAQPAQEPLDQTSHDAQRKPLTDEQITEVIDSMPQGINGWMSDWDLYEYARAVEAKLKEKNT